MARGMALETEYIYTVVFDNDRVSEFQSSITYAYGPYVNLGAARRMLKQENGRWNQINGRILRTKVKWESMEDASPKGTDSN